MNHLEGRRLLGLFPHPDDESYSAAGTLARCARMGARVRLVCATRGESGTDRRRRGNAPDRALGEIRSLELTRSCRVLGAERPILLDLPDGGLASIAPEILVGRIQEILDRERPEVVVTLGRDGVYGNIDHLAWTCAVGAAVARSTPRPRLLHTAFPPGLFRPVWRSLRRCRPRAVSPIEPSPFGLAADRVHLRVDVRPVRHLKWESVRAHASQLEGGDPNSFLRRGLIEPLLDEEWFMVDAGPALPARADHPFAGLDLL